MASANLIKLLKLSSRMNSVYTSKLFEILVDTNSGLAFAEADLSLPHTERGLTYEGMEERLDRPLTKAERNELAKVRVLDLTETIEQVLAKLQPQHSSGSLRVDRLHTTIGYRVNEFEIQLAMDWVADDLRQFPVDAFSGHNEFDRRIVRADERHNGWAHRVFRENPASQTLVLNDGKLALGTYNSLMLLEYDGPQERKITMQAQYSSD